MASTTFQDQMPTPQSPSQTPNPQSLMMNLMHKSQAGDASALMFYYQQMAEKCWGLNSPPASDSSPNRVPTSQPGKKSMIFKIDRNRSKL